ncbi:DUF2851 family protein [bacterium]|nr:DUF2851 family protein [bacterium]
MREAELYSIWANQMLNHDLHTTTGQAIRVIYPGNLNSDRGADFKDATLKIGDVEYHGDVEIHIKKRDWLSHKHQNDPEYNKVILHLIWENDKSRVMTHSHKTIPTLLLSEFYLPDKEIPQKIAYDCHFFSGLDKNQLNYVLLKCGQKRLSEKADIIRQISYLEPYEETIFKVIAGALGSPNNKLGMKLLASEVKKRELKMLSSHDLPIYVEQVSKNVGLSEDNRHSSIWQQFRIRPASKPEKRVKEYIQLRWLFRHENFAILLWDIFNSSDTVKDFIGNVDKLLNSTYEESLFGYELIKIIAYNSLLPFIYSLVSDLKHKKNLAKINQFIKDFPKIGNNRVINSFMNKISDYQKLNLENREIYYQGLYYLMNNYCRRHDCQLCRQERDLYLTIREK